MTDAATMHAALGAARLRALHTDAGLPRHYLDDLAAHVAPLAAQLVTVASTAGTPLIGLNGCQGSGKTTLARFLAALLETGAGIRCLVLSLDDFYLERAQRQRLAADVHPLLLTRGVPGTHDVALLQSTLDALLRHDSNPVALPRFDKHTDDRAPRDRWRFTSVKPDLLLLEGWCVGCSAQSAAALATPVNALERDEDPSGRWRGFVNAALTGDYDRLFARLDRLVVLSAPGPECVAAWRAHQERDLARRLGLPPPATGRLLDGTDINRFLSHYERLTKHQAETLPARADAVIELDTAHRMTRHYGRLYQ